MILHTILSHHIRKDSIIENHEEEEKCITSKSCKFVLKTLIGSLSSCTQKDKNILLSFFFNTVAWENKQNCI